jgi:arsenate reductase (thioredoxin)
VLRAGAMSDGRPRNALFLCTGNSARSILAEAILNREGAGRFRAFSAGSFPKGAVHPMALSVLKELGYETDGFRSKSWDEFAAPAGPDIDLILTVCDNAAGEVCPIWPGRPVTAHWGIADPAAVDGEAQREAFLTAYRRLSERIHAMLDLSLDGLDPVSLSARLRDIGRMEGATQ